MDSPTEGSNSARSCSRMGGHHCLQARTGWGQREFGQRPETEAQRLQENRWSPGRDSRLWRVAVRNSPSLVQILQGPRREPRGDPRAQRASCSAETRPVFLCGGFVIYKISKFPTQPLNGRWEAEAPTCPRDLSKVTQHVHSELRQDLPGLSQEPSSQHAME